MFSRYVVAVKILVIIDVDEQDTDTDLLLVMVRKILRHTRPNVKVILMSANATDAKIENLHAILQLREKLRILSCIPILEVEETEPYPVKVFYTDQINKLLEIISYMSSYIVVSNINSVST